MDIYIKGDVEINKRFLNFISALPDEIKEALIAEAEGVRKVSDERTPVKTGLLRGSSQLMEPEVHGHETSVEVRSGEDVPYAIYVHENLDYIGGYPNGGQSKYLESAVLDSIPGREGRIMRHIKLSRLSQ